MQTCFDKAGVKLIQGDFLEQGQWQLSELSELFRTIQGFEIIEKHGEWLAEYGDSLDPAILERVKWSSGISRDQYSDAQKKQDDFKQKLATQLHVNKVLWVIPTTPSGPPALTMDSEELAIYRSNLMGLTSLAGLSGFPQLHLPMKGLSEGPCGVSLMGLPNQELQLLTAGQLLKGE